MNYALATELNEKSAMIRGIMLSTVTEHEGHNVIAPFSAWAMHGDNTKVELEQYWPALKMFFWF
jgi:hypothetical protein